MSDLLPCAFCGSTNLLIECWPCGEIAGTNYSSCSVNCTDCGAEGPTVEANDGPSPVRSSVAADKWNRRADLPTPALQRALHLLFIGMNDGLTSEEKDEATALFLKYGDGKAFTGSLHEIIGVDPAKPGADRTVHHAPRITPPPPVTVEEMNRPFGPADGSGVWKHPAPPTAEPPIPDGFVDVATASKERKATVTITRENLADVNWKPTLTPSPTFQPAGATGCDRTGETDRET